MASKVTLHQNLAITHQAAQLNSVSTMSNYLKWGWSQTALFIRRDGDVLLSNMKHFLKLLNKSISKFIAKVFI